MPEEILGLQNFYLTYFWSSREAVFRLLLALVLLDDLVGNSLWNLLVGFEGH